MIRSNIGPPKTEASLETGHGGRKIREKCNRGDGLFFVLSLDGGGAKGAYTLGALAVVEKLLKHPISDTFDLVYGTSTGAIIGSMIALGEEVQDIWTRYQDLTPEVMGGRSARARSRKLKAHASDIYGDKTFEAFRTKVGIVTAKMEPHEPMIFKSDEKQLLSNAESFEPGFGCTIADAVVASCSAQPFFEKMHLDLGKFGTRVLVDGGHMANNPTPLALLESVHTLKVPKDNIRVLSLGTGEFPPKRRILHWILHRGFAPFRMFEELTKSSTKTMEWLNRVLFRDIQTERINKTYNQKKYRTSLLEDDVCLLRQIYSLGVEAAQEQAEDLKSLFQARVK